jgi:hypothetical protein
MSDRAETLKLAELRSKTDRQLLVLISNKLDEALVSARCSGDFAAAEQLRDEVRVWLSLTESASPAERRRIDRKLQQLAGLLHRRLRTACA